MDDALNISIIYHTLTIIQYKFTVISICQKSTSQFDDVGDERSSEFIGLYDTEQNRCWLKTTVQCIEITTISCIRSTKKVEVKVNSLFLKSKLTAGVSCLQIYHCQRWLPYRRPFQVKRECVFAECYRRCPPPPSRKDFWNISEITKASSFKI